MTTLLSPVRIRVLPVVKTPPLWRVKVSAFKGDERGVPAIVNLLAQSMELTKEWQLYISDINYNMPVEKVSALLNYRRAFTNGTCGFGNPTTPLRNYILNEDLDAKELPKFDKARTCVGALHTGEAFGDYLFLDSMDGNVPPPKGIMPQTHPWYFFACTNINDRGEIFPFSNGAKYPWYKGGQEMVTWLPLVARFPLKIALVDVERVS